MWGPSDPIFGPLLHLFARRVNGAENRFRAPPQGNMEEEKLVFLSVFLSCLREGKTRGLSTVAFKTILYSLFSATLIYFFMFGLDKKPFY